MHCKFKSRIANQYMNILRPTDGCSLTQCGTDRVLDCWSAVLAAEQWFEADNNGWVV